MLRFEVYPKLQQLSIRKTNDEMISLIEKNNEGISSDTWVVTEKIHGSNFCLCSDGVQVCAARRNAFLKSGDVFHGYETILKQYSAAVIELYLELASNLGSFVKGLSLGDGFNVYVMGELYGGKVQREVFYRPDVSFVAFDIAIVQETRMTFLHYDCARDLLCKHGIHVVPQLFIGPLADAIAFSRECHSNDSVLSLSAAQEYKTAKKGTETTKQREGNVLRPLKESKDKFGERVIYKMKGLKFVETRFEKHLKVVEHKTNETSVRMILVISMTRLTPARVDSVRSKQLETIPVSKLVELVLEDAIDDAMAAMAAMAATATSEQRPSKQSLKGARSATWDLVRSHVAITK